MTCVLRLTNERLAKRARDEKQETYRQETKIVNADHRFSIRGLLMHLHRRSLSALREKHFGYASQEEDQCLAPFALPPERGEQV